MSAAGGSGKPAAPSPDGQDMTFLFGSGISRQLPNVSVLTALVRRPDDVWRGTDAMYDVGPCPVPWAQAGRGRAVQILALIVAEADSFFARDKPQRRLNYEEIAYVVGQVADSCPPYENENPALGPLIASLVTHFGDDLRDVATEGRNLIRDVVWRKLSTPEKPAGLDALVEATRELRPHAICTLNHDVLLERALTAAAVPVSDGFGPSDGDLRAWGDYFPPAVTRLLKLHGSIDWFLYDRPDGSGRKVVAQVDRDPEHVRDGANTALGIANGGRPLILVGTFDKLIGYFGSCFVDLQFRFEESLRTSCRLFICGYGFGDKGVNSRIIAWLDRSADNRMVVAHRHADRLIADARGAIRNAWARWGAAEQVALIPKWAEELTATDIERACFCSPAR